MPLRRQTPFRRSGPPIPMLLLLILTVRSTSAQPSPPEETPPPYNGLSTSFNPSMAIIIVVLISAFFFLGFFSIYVRQCGGGAAPAAASGTGRARGGITQRGLEPEVLDTFPTLAYSEAKNLKVGKGSLECAVCLSEFEDDETLRLLPKCSHVFHPDCIDAWLASHVTCPVCRSNLVPDPFPPSESTDGADREAVVVAPESFDQVAVTVDERDRGEELAELARIGSQRRAFAAATRSKSMPRVQRFPRSNSTGHSVLTRPGENFDRFTLRLPEYIHREIVISAAEAAGRFQRTKSCVAFPASEEASSRRGYRSGEVSSRLGRSLRLGRSDRWPSFLARTLSTRFPGWGNGKKGETEGSFKKSDGGDVSLKGRMPSVRNPFECLGSGAKDNDSNESPSVALNRV
ncbi:hypothetical protein J5N97_009687 [Dioscorea zingiberensis]|uniref:RING-type E3 ubiquitin transferase n=1 Tax=Dioscorea zingiberensis TaxID=325984 RepID=A0A9D5CZ82_9LILI|nr:hypothetical protein J5N97_009687 [Dioscorea zingiberensis]